MITSPRNLVQNRQIPDKNRAIASNRAAVKTLEEFMESFAKELEGSAIAPSLQHSSVAYIDDTGFWEPNQALNQKVSTQYQTRRPHEYGAIAMFVNEDGTYWQGKPLNPRVFDDGKVNKYETPVGNGSRAFLPAVTVAIWRKICDRAHIKEESIWAEALVDAAKQNELITLLQNWSGFGNRQPISRHGEISGTGFASSCSKACIRNQALMTLQELLQPNTPALHSLLQGNFTPEVDAALSCFVTSLPSRTRIPNFWKWLERHPEIRIYLTEGGKKSLALLSQGCVAIALYGVRSGVSKNETIAGEKIRRLKPELIPDLARFVHPDRPWAIAFDQDSKPKTLSDVNEAIADLAFCLERDTREAAERALEKAKKSEDKEEKKAAERALKTVAEKVAIIQWNGQNGRCKGVDDLIFNEGVEAWENALDGAISAPEWRVTQRLKSAVKRKPDMHIGSREFKEIASDLPTSGLVALHGGKGTGKSEAIAAMVQDRPWLSITALRSVARDQAAGFGGVFVNDGDRFGDRLLDESGHPVKGGSVCIPSLLKVRRIGAEVLVLDETTALAEFMLISKLANKDGLRPLLLTEFVRRVQDAQQVILADADLTQEVIDWIEGIRGDRCYLVRSDRHALTYPATVFDGSQNQTVGELLLRAEGLPAGKIVYINCDSKALAGTLNLSLGIQQSLLIDADTSGDAIQSSFLASKGKDIPALIQMGIKFIISSPSVVQGFSITHNTELIDSVWGFYSGCSITAHGMAQGLDRPRSSEVPRFIWVAPRGRAYSKLSKAQSSGAFLKDFKQLNSTAARLVSHSLTPEASAAVDSIDWQGQNLKMLASLEVRRNQSMMELRHTLIALLKHEGKTVETVKPSVSKKEAKAIGRELRAAGQAIKNAHYQAVAAAPELSEIEAIALSAKTEALTPDQLLSLESYYLKEFYRLEQQVTFEDASFDQRGKTRRQIRRLEMILKQELADARTAATINQSPDCPQDWDVATVQWWILEKSGAGQLVRDMYAGKIESYTAAKVQAIADFFKAHPTEFQLAFNYSSIGKVSPVQAIGVILDWCGIKRTRSQVTINKKRESVYTIEKSYLANVSAIIERRGKACTAPTNEGVIGKGVQSENLGNTAQNIIPIAPDIGQGQRQDFPDSEDSKIRYG